MRKLLWQISLVNQLWEYFVKIVKNDFKIFLTFFDKNACAHLPLFRSTTTHSNTIIPFSHSRYLYAYTFCILKIRYYFKMVFIWHRSGVVHVVFFCLVFGSVTFFCNLFLYVGPTWAIRPAVGSNGNLHHVNNNSNNNNNDDDGDYNRHGGATTGIRRNVSAPGYVTVFGSRPGARPSFSHNPGKKKRRFRPAFCFLDS